MAAKRILPITIPASLDIRPEKVRFVKTGAGLQKQVNAAAKAALSGLKITDAGAIGLDPQVAKMSPSVFRNFQRQYDKDTQKLQDIAQGIQAKRVKTEEAGGKLSNLDFIRQKALETTAKVREATKEVVAAERNLGRAVKEKLLTGGTEFTPGQQKRVNAYFEAQKRLSKFLPELDKFQKGGTLFDPLTGRDVILGTQAIKGLTSAMEATSKTASNLSRHVDNLGQSQKKAAKQQAELTKATNATVKADKAAAIARTRNAASMAQFRRQLQGLKRETPKTAADAKRQAASAGSLRTRIEGARTRLTESTRRHAGQLSPESLRQIENTQKRLIALDKAAVAQQKRLGKEYERLNTVASQVVRAKQGIAKASGNMNQQLGQSSLLIRQFFRYALGYGALYQALGAFNALTRSVIELDKALFSIKAIADATNDEMISISSAIKRVAIETKFTTREVAKGAQILAQAGVGVSELPKALEAVSKFAAGTETQIATAADLVSTMRNVFTELDDLDITNQLTKAINISKLTGQDLRVILGISAQVAKQYNLTSEQYLSAVTVLRNAGLKASTTATGLRQGLIELFSPDSKTTKALVTRYKDLGENLTSKEVRDKFFGFTRDLNPLLSAARELRRLGLSGSGRKTLTRGFDVRATNALTALVNNLEQLEKSQNQLASGDQVFVASATQMESLANSADNLGAAMTVLAADITEGPIRVLEDLVDGATEAIQSITDLSIEAKSLGREGASGILSSAVSGALLGAVLGKTPIAKFAAGLGGAAVGGAVGVQQLEQRASGESNFVDANSLNTAIGVVAVLSMFRGGSAGGALSTLFRGKQHPSAFVGPIRTGVTGFLGRLVEVGITFKNFIVPSMGRLALAATGVGAAVLAAFTVLELFTSDQEDRNKALKEQRKALNSRAARIEKQRQELETDISSADAYRTSQESAGKTLFSAKTSGVAEALERNLGIAKNYDLVLAQTFGDIGEEAQKEIETLLESYRRLGFEKGSPGYTAAFKRLAELTGFDEEGIKLLEDQVNFLSNSRTESLQAAKGFQADFKKRLRQAQEAEIVGNANAQQQALLATFRADTEEIREASIAFTSESVDGSTETFESFLAFISLYAENIDRINKITQRQAELQENRLSAAVLDLQLLLKEASGTDDIAIRVQTLKSQLAILGGQSAEFIDILLGELNVLEATLAQETAQLNRNRIAVTKPIGGGYSSLRSAYAARTSAERDRSDNTQDLAELQIVRRHLQEVAKVRTDATTQSNKELAETLLSNLDRVSKFTPEDVALLKSRPEDTARIQEVKLQSLVDDPEARRAFLKANILGEGAVGGPVPKRAELQFLSQLGKALIDLVADLDSLRASSPDDKRELVQPTFIRDPATYRQIFELDEQIKQAKKKNLQLIVDANQNNPLILRRNLLLKEKDREIALQSDYVNDLRDEFGIDIGDRRDRQKVERATAKLAQLGIDRLKITSDAEIERETAGLKLEDQILAARQKRLEIQESLLATALEEAAGAGGVDDIARINHELFNIRNQLLDVEIAKLQLSEQDNELTNATEALKRDELQLQEDINRQKQELAALAKKETIAVSRLQGDADTQGGLAFADAAGAGATVTDQQRDLQEALQTQLDIAIERNNLAKETLEREKREGATPDRLAELELNLLQTSIAAGRTAGELYRVTEQLNGYFLTFEGFRQAWMESTTDMTDAIRDSLAEWYHNAPRTIETFLENIGSGIKTGLERVFTRFTDNALFNIVQRGMDATLGFLSDSFGFDREAIKDQVNITASNVVISTPNAGGSSTVEAISGAGVVDVDGEVGEDGLETENQAANTQQLQALTSAVVGASGSTEAHIAQLATNAAFDQVAAAQQTAAGVGISAALTTNTVALGVNTSALYSQAASGAINLQRGGVIRMQKGGIVKGPKGIDKVPGVIVGANGRKEPAALTHGEGVLTTRAVDYLGEPFVNAINSMKLPAVRLAQGGVIGNSSTGMGKLSKALASMPGPNVDARTKVVVLHTEEELLQAMRGEAGERIIVGAAQKNASAIVPYQ